MAGLSGSLALPCQMEAQWETGLRLEMHKLLASTSLTGGKPIPWRSSLDVKSETAKP